MKGISIKLYVQVSVGVRDTPGGHTSYKTQRVCVKQKPNQKTENNHIGRKKKKKVDKIMASMNISIDGHESQVNNERVNQ